MAYISVADAVERTGRGKTTIYRLCRKHEHTQYILREDKKFLIDEHFLSSQFEQQLANGAGEEKRTEAAEAKQELVDVFIQELLKEQAYYRVQMDRKDEQLERKDTLIMALQERQRELSHFLQHQNRLLEEAQQAGKDNAAPALPMEQVLPRQRTTTSRPTKAEIRAVYAVLGFVALLLGFALVYQEEIRALVAG